MQGQYLYEMLSASIRQSSLEPLINVLQGYERGDGLSPRQWKAITD